jgi:hypothetical protein
MKYFLTLLLVVCFVFINAQKTKNYKKHPYWIDMIKEPNVNYFEAIKAYETFWDGKHKPLEENELIGQTKGTASKEEKMESRKEMRERKREKEMYKKYGLECKKFEHWKMQVKPYVQSDGTIISKEEQLKMWEAEKK